MQEWRVTANVIRNGRMVFLPSFCINSTDVENAIDTAKIILNPDKIMTFYVVSILSGERREYVNWPVYNDYINGVDSDE